MMKKTFPALYSLPQLEKFALPDRATAIAQIESGELDHLDFFAFVINTKPNRNHLTFQSADLPAFAASFKGMPFLRNHDQSDIGARDGTIIDSKLTGDSFEQLISLTTRRLRHRTKNCPRGVFSNRPNL